MICPCESFKRPKTPRGLKEACPLTAWVNDSMVAVMHMARPLWRCIWMMRLRMDCHNMQLSCVCLVSRSHSFVWSFAWSSEHCVSNEDLQIVIIHHNLIISTINSAGLHSDLFWKLNMFCICALAVAGLACPLKICRKCSFAVEVFKNGRPPTGLCSFIEKLSSLPSLSSKLGRSWFVKNSDWNTQFLSWLWNTGPGMIFKDKWG